MYKVNILVVTLQIRNQDVKRSDDCFSAIHRGSGHATSFRQSVSYQVDFTPLCCYLCATQPV